MTMAVRGVAKLIEECGELTQILGKKLAYWYTDDHPDGMGSITERIQNEIGDVLAACTFVRDQLNLDADAIDSRCINKMMVFDTWQEQIDNNDFAIDGKMAHEHCLGLTQTSSKS